MVVHLIQSKDNFNVNGPHDSPYDAAFASVDASGQTAHGSHCPRHCSAPSYEIYDGTNPEDCTQWTYATGVSGSANKKIVHSVYTTPISDRRSLF